MKHWKKVALVVCLGAWVYFMAFHFDRFKADFWPLDSSRVGPNLVASVVQWALIGFLLYLLYPPVKKAIDAFTKRHVESIKAHVSAEHAAVHAKLDHVIRHSTDIPAFDADSESLPHNAAETILDAPMKPVKPKRVRKIVPKL